MQIWHFWIRNDLLPKREKKEVHAAAGQNLIIGLLSLSYIIWMSNILLIQKEDSNANSYLW